MRARRRPHRPDRDRRAGTRRRGRRRVSRGRRHGRRRRSTSSAAYLGKADGFNQLPKDGMPTVVTAVDGTPGDHGPGRRTRRPTPQIEAHQGGRRSDGRRRTTRSSCTTRSGPGRRHGRRARRRIRWLHLGHAHRQNLPLSSIADGGGFRRDCSTPSRASGSEPGDRRDPAGRRQLAPDDMPGGVTAESTDDLRRRHPGHPEVVAAPSAGSRVPVEERLFSLVLALLATETGLTKNEILSTVQGYRQRYKSGGDNANLERQFERDKDDIRELGRSARDRRLARRRRQQPDAALPHPARRLRTAARPQLLQRRDHAAEPRRDGLARGLAVGGVASRPAQAALARRRGRRARHRLRAARPAARFGVRPAQQRARAASDRALPLSEAG